MNDLRALLFYLYAGFMVLGTIALGIAVVVWLVATFPVVASCLLAAFILVVVGHMVVE